MAKLTIGDYEVEVSAVSTICGDELDTLSFLNELSIIMGEAAYYNAEHNFKAFERKWREMSDQIYKYCKESGLYEKHN